MPEAIASYKLRVRYDPRTHELVGDGQVAWINTSTDAVPDLQFHLYLNAFRNAASTYMREDDDAEATARRLAGRWGWTDITKLTLENGTDLTDRIRPYAPDDDNADDRSVARVELPRPVAPGALLRFTYEFRARLPVVINRTGWAKDFVMAAQWYPKLGVYEPAGRRGRSSGGWNCHQFHVDTEFFADFGDYEVTITVPRAWKVGATGSRVWRHENQDGTASERFAQRGVHDFVWTASPRFEVAESTFVARREIREAEIEAVARTLERKADDLRLPDLKVRILAWPGERRAIDRTFASVFSAIRYHGLWFGSYAYDDLTILIPPRDAQEATGMEYPTFFTSWRSFGDFPGHGDIEETVIHEYGHQYWYAMLANNEFEEAWLDEGLASYTATKVMERDYPQTRSVDVFGVPIPGVVWHELVLPWKLLGLDPPDGWATLDVPLFGVYGTPISSSNLTVRRRRFIERPASDAVVRNAWQYADRDANATNTYSRPTALLATLERMVGSPAWPRVMRTFAENDRFKHTTTRDFIVSLESVTGQDWGWFFDQFFYDNRRVDYAVTQLSNDEVEELPGVYGEGGEHVERTPADLQRAERLREKARKAAGADSSADDSTRYRSRVRIARLGDGVVPVELAVYFADGTRLDERWDGRYAWKQFEYLRVARIDSAVIDPEEKVLIDTNRLNNSYAAKANHAPAQRWAAHWMLWVQNFLQLVGWLA